MFCVRAGLAAALMTVAAYGTAAAQGTWFDIGSGSPSRIYCEDDRSSWIEFAAYPFGSSWPMGTLVYAELEKRSFPGLPVAYSIKFYDGGCGCGRDLSKPIAFRFHYAQSIVTWPEESTSLFRRNGDVWKVETALLDTEQNVFSGIYWGFVIEIPTFGIGPSSASGDRTSSWGRVKALYGGD